MKVIKKKNLKVVKGGMDAVTAAARKVNNDFGWDDVDTGGGGGGGGQDYNGSRSNR